MGALIELLLLSVLCASVGTVKGACRHVQNEDMLEYSCVGGQLSDLNSLPEYTGKIRISNMPVPVITRDMLARFGPDLWVFGCSYCGIRDIEPGAFQHLENLQQLSLDNNQLTTIRESTVGGLQYLTYLDLNYNAISSIDDGVFQTLPGLIDLRLSGNRLECLNLEAVSKLKELKRMFLTENPQFKCPNAVSAYLETRGVNFEKDPEWDRITEDQVAVELPDDYETDYYDSTTMQNTPLPPYRERLRPTLPSLPPQQKSTTSLPDRISGYGSTFYHPNWTTPQSVAPLEPATDSPDQQSVHETTLRTSGPRHPESSVTRSGGQQPTYSSEANPVPLAPVQQQPSFVESDAGRATESNVIVSPQMTSDDFHPVVNTAPPEYRKTPYPIQSTEEVIVGALPSDTPTLIQPASPDVRHTSPSVKDPIAVQPGQTTTDKPLPDCNSSSTIQRSLGLVIFAVLVVLSGHGFVEGF